MPDGSTQRLDQFLGLNQIGDAGLRDKVNQHFLATFGAAGAVGLISGLAQWLGTAGLTGGTGERTVIIAGGAADSASQANQLAMSNLVGQGYNNAFNQAQQAQQFGANLGLQGLQAGAGMYGQGIGAQQAAYNQAMQGAQQYANLGNQAQQAQIGLYALLQA